MTNDYLSSSLFGLGHAPKLLAVLRSPARSIPSPQSPLKSRPQCMRIDASVYDPWSQLGTPRATCHSDIRHRIKDCVQIYYFLVVLGLRKREGKILPEGKKGSMLLCYGREADDNSLIIYWKTLISNIFLRFVKLKLEKMSNLCIFKFFCKWKTKPKASSLVLTNWILHNQTQEAPN